MDHPETIGTEPPTIFSRREFLTQAWSLGIAAAVLPWLAHRWAVSALAAVEIQDLSLETTSLPSATAPPPPSGSGTSPDYNLFQSPQQYALSLGTGPPVQVFGFYGGEPVAQFITDPAAADGSFPKKPSRIQYRDIVFYYLPVQGAAINAWLIDSLAGKVPPVGGGIHIQGGQSGMSGNTLPNSYSGHMSFAGAFVKQIAFPKADRASEMPAPLRITLAIQQADWHPHSVDESTEPVKGRTETETVRSGYPKCHTFALQTGLCPGGNVLRETRAGIAVMDNGQPRSQALATCTRRTQ